MKIDQYEIVDLVGEGGMGRVDRTRDTRLGRTVAIPSLESRAPRRSCHLRWRSNPDRLYRFEQEARSTAALNHPVAWRSRRGAGQSPRGAHFDTAAGDHYQRRVLLN